MAGVTSLWCVFHSMVHVPGWCHMHMAGVTFLGWSYLSMAGVTCPWLSYLSMAGVTCPWLELPVLA